jgi:molybdenum cofactor synthesis domain-containing protein
LSNDTLRAGILAIGNEVIDGIVLDTNSNWMEQQLIAMGVEMRRVVTVRDEVEEIGKGLKFLCEECDVVITSGGLGPTHDDMTLHSIAIAVDVPLQEDQKAIEIVERQYRTLHEKEIVASPEMTESRLKMARIPQGSTPLDNTVGGAPGVMLEYNGTVIFCLPGVPAELKDIWDRGVKSWILEHVKGSYYERLVEFEVVDESVFAPFITKAMDKHPDVWIKSMPKRYGTTRVMRVWISSRGSDESELKQRVDATLLTLEQESGLKILVYD